jgi:hypothetical protein
VPNRRRRRLSTALSTVAALAVASPVALLAASELTSPSDQTQHREFVQAASITDLPNELISALSQGLSQFGINLPPLPGLLGGGASAPATSLSPGLGSGLGTGLGTPALGTPTLTDPGLANPALTNPALTSPTGAVPGLGSGLATPAAPGLGSGLTTPAAAPSLTDPALAAPGLTTPGLTTPVAASGLTTPPALGVAPVSTAGLPLTGEVPIAAPTGVDPALGVGYPVLGDPSLAAPTAPVAQSGGLLGDLSSAANQLGAGEAIDLLKGVLMPAIMSAVKPPVPPAAAAPAAAAAAAPVQAGLGAAEAAIEPGA